MVAAAGDVKNNARSQRLAVQQLGQDQADVPLYRQLDPLAVVEPVRRRVDGWRACLWGRRHRQRPSVHRCGSANRQARKGVGRSQRLPAQRSRWLRRPPASRKDRRLRRADPRAEPAGCSARFRAGRGRPGRIATACQALRSLPSMEGRAPASSFFQPAYTLLSARHFMRLGSAPPPMLTRFPAGAKASLRARMESHTSAASCGAPPLPDTSWQRRRFWASPASSGRRAP